MIIYLILLKYFYLLIKYTKEKKKIICFYII
jgi:hypothetical protein